MNEEKKRYPKTYNRRNPLVVTYPTTNLPACGLHAVSSRVGAPSGYELVRNLGARATSASTLYTGAILFEHSHPWCDIPFVVL